MQERTVENVAQMQMPPGGGICRKFIQKRELNTMPYKNTDGIDEQPPFMRASYVNVRNYL
jgi:hypothetical protein